MANYFRITAYHPVHDLCIIADSNGRFGKLWEFSSFLIQRGFKVIEVNAEEKFRDGNFEKAPQDPAIVLRACAKGRPEIHGNTVCVHGRTYEVIR